MGPVEKCQCPLGHEIMATMLPALSDVVADVARRQQIHRCLVRGYHRRANPGRKDQDRRFVTPYWRGPEDAPIVERPYRLLP